MPVFHRTALHLSPLALAIAITSAADPAGAADIPSVTSNNTANAGKTDAQLGTVTVNARRRIENVQDVPTPVSVIDGTTLEDQRIYRIQDLQQLAPSTTVSYQHARQASVAIRGLGNNPANDGLEGSAGIYLDNVYLGRPGMAVFDLLDVQQIDVLRGPQGTLFGKNTTAGVVNITTRAPTFTPEHSIETSIGQRGYVQTKGSISGPLNDELAGRLSVYRTREDGATENLYDNNEVNGGQRRGLRGQLLWKPSETFDARLIADYNEEKSTYGTPTLYSEGPTVNGVSRYRQRLVASGASLVQSSSKVRFDGDTTKTTFQGGLSAELNWRLPSDFTLTSISAYRWWDFTPNNDDGVDVPAMLNNGVAVHDKQWSQEIRLASPVGDTFDYVLGAYYFRQELDDTGGTDYGSAADSLYGTATGALNNVTTRTDGRTTTDSYAVFSQGSWHLTDRDNLTVGLRGTYEEKSARLQRYDPQGASVGAAAQAARQAQLGAFDSGDLSQHGFSPSALISLSHRFNPELLAYASLSHGEKAGGISMTVGSARTAGADSLLIGPERSNDAEIGLKSTLLDGSLLLNGNLFWTQVRGYQATAYNADLRAQYLTNAGEVRSRGAEADATWRISRHFTVNANASFNDARYTDYKNGTCSPEVSYATGASSCDLTGATVPGASKWIANVNGHYQWNLDNGLQPYANGSYAFRYHTPGTLDDSRYSVIPSYGLVNLSTGLRGDLGSGQWDLSVWLKNALNKTYYTYVSSGGNGSYNGFTGDPRTLGVTARYDF